METLKAIAKRKSIRGYTSEQISESALQTILRSGSSAPVANGRYEVVHLTVIQDTNLLKKISVATAKLRNASNDPLYGAPTLVMISASQPMLVGLDYANASCMAENMMLAATDIGIGSVYLWGAAVGANSDAELIKALGIPDGFQPVIAVALGYAVQPDDTEKELKVTVSCNRV